MDAFPGSEQYRFDVLSTAFTSEELIEWLNYEVQESAARVDQDVVTYLKDDAKFNAVLQELSRCYPPTDTYTEALDKIIAIQTNQTPTPHHFGDLVMLAKRARLFQHSSGEAFIKQLFYQLLPQADKKDALEKGLAFPFHKNSIEAIATWTSQRPLTTAPKHSQRKSVKSPSSGHRLSREDFARLNALRRLPYSRMTDDDKQFCEQNKICPFHKSTAHTAESCRMLSGNGESPGPAHQ